MRTQKSLAAAVALLGILVGAGAALGQFLPVLLDGPMTTVGETMFTVSVLSFLVNPIGILLVGYWGGTRLDVAVEYRSVLVVFGLVGGVATAVGYLLVAGVALADGFGSGVAAISFAVGYNAAVQVLNFAATGFAGAALAEFRGA